MAIAEVAACIALVKGLNDAISTAKEAGNNASAFANIVGKFAKANDAVLTTEKKHIEFSLSDFADDFKINSIRNWKNSNCKNMIFNTDTGWSSTQIIKDDNENLVLNTNLVAEFLTDIFDYIKNSNFKL